MDVELQELQGLGATDEDIALMSDLQNLLGSTLTDENSGMSQDPALGVKMFIEELDDEALYVQREEIVQRNLLQFFDNPKIPTIEERTSMFRQLGETFWYDQWLLERTQAVDQSELVTEIENTMINPAQKQFKSVVEDAFKKIEIQELEASVMRDTIQAASNHELNLALSAVDAYEEKMEFVPDDWDQPLQLESLEMVEVHPYFAIDENSQVISQASLDAMEGSLQESIGWDLMPSVSEAAQGLLEMGTGAVGGLAVYGIIEGLTPIVKSLLDTDWIRNPALTPERKKMIHESLEQVGHNYELSMHIRKHFRDNVLVIWYHDSINARLKTDEKRWGTDDELLWSARMTPVSGLWVRARVIYMEGTLLGFDEPWQNGLSACVQTDSKTRVWIDLTTASILKDSPAVQYACNTKNLALNIFQNVKPPKVETSSPSPDQDILNRLKAGVQDTTWHFVDDDKTEPDTFTLPVVLNQEFKKGDRVTYAKPSGERVHGQVLDRSGRSDYLFKADDISRVGSDRLLVNFDTLAAESEKYKKWREAKLEAERLKKERLRQQKKDIHDDWVAKIQQNHITPDSKEAVRARMRAIQENALELDISQRAISTYIENDWPFSQLGKPGKPGEDEKTEEENAGKNFFEDSDFSFAKRRKLMYADKSAIKHEPPQVEQIPFAKKSESSTNTFFMLAIVAGAFYFMHN